MIRRAETGGDAPAARAAGLSALTLPVAIIAGAVAGYLLSLPVKPVFVADARVLVGTGGQVPAGFETYSDGIVESEVAVLKSRELAAQMIERHDLARRLDTGAGPSVLDTVLIAAGLRSNPSRASIDQRALEAIENRLEVQPVGSSRVIDISFSAGDPALAAKVVNAIADTYVNDLTIASQRTDHANLQWLQGEIKMMRQRVGEADRRLERYRSGSELFNVLADGRQTDLASQELSELNAELVRAKAAHAEALARATVVRQILKQGSSVEAAREVLDSVLIQRLREQQVKLQSQKAELSSTYLSSHPKIESLQSQLDDLDKQIRSEIRKVLKSVEMAAEISGARLVSLRESLNEVKSVAAKSNDKSAEFRALEQDARSQRELLETFLTRYRMLAAQSGGQRPGARIISRAQQPGQARSPVRLVWAAYGAATGLALAFLLALFKRINARDFSGEAPEDHDEVADLLLAAQRRQARQERVNEAIEELAARQDTDVSDMHPVEEKTPAGSTHAEAQEAPIRDAEESPADRVPAQQASAEEAAQQPLPAADDIGLSNAARIGELIENAPGTAELGRMLAENPARIVLFAGAGSELGTDHLAVAAAAHAAAAGCVSVLLDIGLRPSSILTPDVRAPGLGHLISGTAPFGRVIRRNEHRGVDVIGMGRALGNPPLKRLTTAVANLARRYDKVILVADRVEDWPDLFVKPDFAVLVCDPEIDERSRRAFYDSVLKRGARKALIVRNEWPPQQPDSVAA